MAAAILLSAVPASAHGFSSTVYADLTAPAADHVRAELGLEYDLLVVSAADYEKDDPLFKAGTAAFDAEDARQQAAALKAHMTSVDKYVAERFTISAGGQACTATQQGDFTIQQRDGVPYAFVALDYRCAEANAHEVRSSLFPDSETYVKGTKTIVTYDLDLQM